MGDERKSILLADDDPKILEVTRRVLSDKYDVITAADGDEAVGALERSRVVAVVADQRMPGRSGVEVLCAAARLQPWSARVLFTGVATLADLDGAVNDARIHRFLSKPLRLLDLEAGLASAIEQASLEQLVAQQRTEVERLGQLVLRDSLTGLYNHRHFKDALQTEVARARRYAQTVSLIFIDVDHFKNFNDRAGHPAGDRLLVHLGRILQHSGEPTRELPLRGRACDFAARYGGEEFVVMLPHTDLMGAGIKADRIRRAISGYPFAKREVQPGGKLTLSVGVASAAFPESPLSGPQLIECADEAMLLAKRSGRDQVRLHGIDESFSADDDRSRATG